MLTNKHLNLLCHSLDFIAVLAVAGAIISTTIKRDKSFAEELKDIENALDSERAATIGAISVASLSFAIKLYTHFR